jgi:hypothetical protein
MRVLTATLCALFVMSPLDLNAREQGYLIEGRIIDGEFPNDPKFHSAPAVHFKIFNDETPAPEELALVTGQPPVERNGTAYLFSQTTPGGLSLASAHIFFTIGLDGYILKRPETARKEIPRRVDDLGLIPVQFELVRRSVLADASRQEATEALDKARPGPADFERAEISARKAITIDPTLDNYLNLFDIIRKANRTDYPELMIDFHSTEALNGLPGFNDLSFAEQWRLRRELLITLLRMPDLDAPLGFSGSVRDAAVSVGQDMVTDLSDGEDYTALPVIEVFRALAKLHATNGDCPSLIDANARALELADEAAMNWGSRRLFLLEWSDCLLRRSGIGDGRSEDAFLSDAAASPVLSQEWARFEDAAGAFEADFAYPASDADARLLKTFERARIISEKVGSQ